MDGVADIAGGVVVGGYACRRCGYALAGLSVAGVCPECGLEVAASTGGSLLEHASPEYLRVVHRGLMVGEWATIGVVGAAVAPVAFRMLGMSDATAVALGDLGSVLVAGAALAGWWMVAAPEPRRGMFGTGRGRGEARALRMLAAAGLGLAVAGFVGPFALRAAGRVFEAEAIRGPLNLLRLGAFAGMFVASTRVIRGLARRVPNARVARWATTLLWLCPVLSVVCALAMFAGPLMAMALYVVLIDDARGMLRRVRERAAKESVTAGILTNPGAP